MTMSSLFRRMKLRQSSLHYRSRLISFQPISRCERINFDDDVNKSNHNSRNDLSLPDDVINKYLKSLATALTSKYKCDSNISSIIEVPEVIDLLKNRSHIEENMKSLEELGEQDEEMKKLGHDEYTAYQNLLHQYDEQLLDVILENTGNDNCRDIIFEMTAGVGGQEAMIFTSDLLNMYRKHFEYLGFNHDIVELDTESSIGGLRHATILVSGERAFELLHHEGGVHRVQRIPLTERSGRMHTSTATVVILPQPTEIDVNLQDKDLKIESKRSSGAGGQSVNTADSAIRITHLPTGMVVEAQSERSQIQNKKIALIKLRAKIYDTQMNEQQSEQSASRKKQRGMSGRNEKIRTYNYSQDRITDHRLMNGTFRNLKVFMLGGERLQDLQEKLQRDLKVKLLREAIEKCK